MGNIEGGSAGASGISQVGGGALGDVEGGKSHSDGGNADQVHDAEASGSAGSFAGDMGLAGELNLPNVCSLMATAGCGSRPDTEGPVETPSGELNVNKFGGWTPIPGLGTFASGPAALTRGSTILDVYARGTDNSFWQNFAFTTNGVDWNWLGWQPFGSGFSGKPGATTWGPTRDAVAVAGRATSDHIFVEAVLPPGLFKSWAAVRDDVFVKDPAITYSQPYLFLFALKSNGFLYFSKNDTTTGYDPNNWTAWAFIPNGTLASEPTAATANGQIFVTARGTDDKFWITSSANQGASWTLFRPIPSSMTFAFGPALVSSPNGQLNIFGTALGTGQVWNSTSNDSGGTWTTFLSLGGPILDGPSAASPDNGTIRIFGRGIDSDIWYNMYQE